MNHLIKEANILEELEEYIKLPSTKEECLLKINRAEVPAVKAYSMGKDEGARLLALRILEIIAGR